MARILIAEDDESVREFVARALTLRGHEVTATADGGEAASAVARADGAFDLVLADIKMPVMDGIALALLLSRDRPQLPIMLMTGFADQRERAHGLDSIVREVVTKPFTLAEIAARVEAVLEAEGSGKTQA